MTSYKDFFLDKAKRKRWCADSSAVTKNVPVETIYQGTDKPQWWIVVLGYTNPTRAKEVLALAVQNAGNTLDASELKDKMLAFSATMTEQQIDDLMAWAKPKRKATSLFELPDKVLQHLCALLYSAAKYLKYGEPTMLMPPVLQLISYKVISEGISRPAAIAAFYEFLHAEVDLTTWRGDLT